MSFLKQHLKACVVLGILIAGAIIVSPYSDFQDYLSQGDHGRDLYAAQAVYRGELPYRDFWWVYGPLTPYYYGLFFKIFGTKISSMILGKSLLRILAGVFMGLGLMEIASPLAALLGACWFILFQQDFFFTYNHIAGIAMMLGVVWCWLAYIKRNSMTHAWAALFFVFVLCLIKVNFGIVSLLMSVGTLVVCDTLRRVPAGRDKKLFYGMGLLLLPLAVFTIYYALLHGLSSMEIRECLPYKEGDQPYETSPWLAIANFLGVLIHTLHHSWMNLLFAVIINGCALRCVYLCLKNKLPSRMDFLLSLIFILVFYVLNSHEYLKSGVWYRDFWAQPLSIMLIFFLVDTGARSLHPAVRKLIFTFVGVMAILCWVNVLRIVNTYKIDSQLVQLPRGQIYVGNAPAWIQTVEQTTAYLNNTLKGNELFFALPYDCLYYYLTDKRAPTRQLIFFDHIKIPQDQEKAVIAQLEANHVNYVLVSNRAFVRQGPGLGFLGTTYCPLIGRYLHDHFSPVARFGDWQHEPGWAWNHGTMILKRKVP